MALFGTVMALVLTLAVVAPVFGSPPAGIPPSHQVQGHHRAPLLATGTTLTISGSGTAYKIGNRTITEGASVSLTATVVKSSPGRAMLNFTGGTLTIGSDTYTVVSGHGVINHAHKMILHIVVKNSAGATFRLILHGDHAKPSSTTAFNVDFRMPQSKLTHLWFLNFP
ncbi:hypothetical protein AUH73_06365 [archaeon 13_1_40CM_4_53_4]|nr:MAG: hypothetical protein AUH73_06365 [archaeon 13_1_40CM_4_53_4]